MDMEENLWAKLLDSRAPARAWERVKPRNLVKVFSALYIT